MAIRLQKFLADAGISSRRAGEQLITSGRVAVNGAVILRLGTRVDPLHDNVTVDGIFGPATLKYSHAVTNLFGFSDSKNSYYVDLNATFETGYWGLSVIPHIGYQKVKNNGDFSYTDWSVGLAKDFGNGFSASLTYVDTNNSRYRSPEGKDLGKPTAVLGGKYTF